MKNLPERARNGPFFQGVAPGAGAGAGSGRNPRAGWGVLPAGRSRFCWQFL